MLRVALTGGIGSGKSTATDLFSQLGVPIIDADVIAKSLLEPQTDATKQVIAHFGSAVLTNQQLDRQKLRKIIFNQANEKKWLEQLLHPLIRKEINRQIAQCDKPYCIVSIALLLENKLDTNYDRTLVVIAEPEQQINRATKRDNTERSIIEQILASQVDNATRKRAADDVIDNSSDLKHLAEQVSQLHAQYLQISKS